MLFCSSSLGIAVQPKRVPVKSAAFDRARAMKGTCANRDPVRADPFALKIKIFLLYFAEYAIPRFT